MGGSARAPRCAAGVALPVACSLHPSQPQQGFLVRVRAGICCLPPLCSLGQGPRGVTHRRPHCSCTSLKPAVLCPLSIDSSGSGGNAALQTLLVQVLAGNKPLGGCKVTLGAWCTQPRAQVALQREALGAAEEHQPLGSQALEQFQLARSESLLIVCTPGRSRC